ncbi:tyrosine--tRNA ligase [Helicobacter sp. MIT 14-3879]|uniref:tyrosine--tRNA ligase n=1 Tax=Helicobacter sp. MIT 14-3879 TaxID=2040649 RepID=UPI000E1E8837|nr:tyrosine--tRNA ligase [Helicobacter sp. MIT 14-3879]RDU61652.1 tyrosine--tRNA ligase [Helicobacter sp. MIT 14-3879]
MQKKINEALREIQRGVSEIIGMDYIKSLVERFYANGTRFVVKAGFDPTAPDLHLGHSVLLHKMAVLQKYGANIKFLIGDFTGMIGDPSGKSETRKSLSKEEVLKNAETYKTQVFKILNPAYTEICFNSQWLNKLGTEGMIKLSAKFSVARMLERDDFAKRFKENLPISIVEFMYPLLQGYDSVALECDVECGGNDQKFNLLVGRSMQRSYGLNKEQSILMMPLLEGLDGVNKMSKSLKNYIGITDNPDEMYGKIMSISDNLMWRYYELISTVSLKDLEAIKQKVDEGLNPKNIKENLAFEIVSRYHDESKAKKAKENFKLIFSQNTIPDDLNEINVESNSWICKVLVDNKISQSSSEARRSIKAGALKINGEKMLNENFKLSSGIYVLQIGKRKFLKVKVK